jgi:positive regulator of sigma E activity
MTEKGIVININKKYIEIEIKSDITFCDKCKLCKQNTKTKILKVLNPGGIKLGELVEIEIPEYKIIFSQFLLYGFPIIMLIFGFLFPDILKLNFKNEIISFSIGIIFFTISLLIVKYFYKNLKVLNIKVKKI